MPTRHPPFDTGDKVIIVSFVPNPYNGAASDMVKYIGNAATVLLIDRNNGFVRLKDNGWWWHPTLLRVISRVSDRKKNWPKHFQPKI